MEIHLPPDVQEKLDQQVAETGLAATEFVQDGVAGYLAEVAQVRKTLDGRYDDIKSGRVKRIPGEEVRARLLEKSAARRLQRT
jgi:hypothetical protein